MRGDLPAARIVAHFGLAPAAPRMTNDQREGTDMESDGGAESIARELVGRLERAWNAADGAAFGAPFAADADFVDIRGTHHRGREAIAGGHQGIFESIYRGSELRYRVTDARALADGVILAHSEGEIAVPAGPMAGTHRATQSLVFVRGGAGWEIASFQNTLVAPPPPGPPPGRG